MLKRVIQIASMPFPFSSKMLHMKRTFNKYMFDLLLRFNDLKVTAQVKVINSNVWNNLVVLDACRYDVFEQMVHEFLDGKLFITLSPGSNTIQWLKRTWYGHYPDIIYFSSNPHVNSRICVKGFCAKDKFKKVIDVWNLGWDETIGTVPPQNVNKIVKRALTAYRLRRILGYKLKHFRVVIHYMQPHFPYITIQKNINSMITEVSEIYNVSKETVFLMLLKALLNDEHKVIRVLRRLYAENLRMALAYVADLISYLDGTTIITSDHGELFGEYGMYFHQTNAPLPLLRAVPLFIVK